MKTRLLSISFLLLFVLSCLQSNSQLRLQEGDPKNPEVPSFFKSKLSDIEAEVKTATTAKIEVIAKSPGGLPVYAFYYGEKENFKSQANYNSAIGARNPVHYAKKQSTQKPVVYFIGPVHGHEVENIVGLVNLIHVAETGKDYRGKEWKALKEKIDKCRTIVVPCGNPDGRKRCPYDSFLGLPTQVMTKYGQGTRRDGSLYGWPLAKSVHPMKGDVGILGAYFNDDGINVMQDEFFKPMAKETTALMEIARIEAPDITVSQHSHENVPMILQPAHVGVFMKKKVHDLALRLNRRYMEAGIPALNEDRLWKPQDDDQHRPQKTFNLTSALHHISGTMSFTFECTHGSLPKNVSEPRVSYEDILDIQLLLFDEMYNYILENKPVWE